MKQIVSIAEVDRWTEGKGSRQFSTTPLIGNNGLRSYLVLFDQEKKGYQVLVVDKLFSRDDLRKYLSVKDKYFLVLQNDTAMDIDSLADQVLSSESYVLIAIRASRDQRELPQITDVDKKKSDVVLPVDGKMVHLRKVVQEIVSRNMDRYKMNPIQGARKIEGEFVGYFEIRDYNMLLRYILLLYDHGAETVSDMIYFLLKSLQIEYLLEENIEGIGQWLMKDEGEDPKDMKEFLAREEYKYRAPASMEKPKGKISDEVPEYKGPTTAVKEPKEEKKQQGMRERLAIFPKRDGQEAKKASTRFYFFGKSTARPGRKDD